MVGLTMLLEAISVAFGIRVAEVDLSSILGALAADSGCSVHAAWKLALQRLQGLGSAV